MSELLALAVAFCGGGLVVWLLQNARVGAATLNPPPPPPSDWRHILDLLSRAHHARAAWLLTATGEVAATIASPEVPGEMLERAVGIARLTLQGGSGGVTAHRGEVLIATDEDVAAAALPDPASDTTLLLADLTRVAAAFRVSRDGGAHISAERPAWDATLPALDSVESVTFALCESARQLTGRPTAVVLRDPNSQLPSVVAVSHDGDRRWLAVRVTAESASGRASRGSQAVVALTGAELLGGAPSDRRRGEDGGTAYPLRDARDGAGALIVFGPHETIEPRVREQVARLAVAAGPRLAAAAALRAAEARALTDELTGLANRRALHRAMGGLTEGPGALLALDLDHFKTVNDTHGHQAGDMVLKHIAHVISGSLRDGDLAARTGGEEFSLWLPGAPLKVAVEVAERIRAAVQASRANWQGQVLSITCSIGVAAMPESATQAQNLAALADAALYRAKHAGRNRVETASGAGRPAPAGDSLTPGRRFE